MRKLIYVTAFILAIIFTGCTSQFSVRKYHQDHQWTRVEKAEAPEIPTAETTTDSLAVTEAPVSDPVRPVPHTPSHRKPMPSKISDPSPDAVEKNGEAHPSTHKIKPLDHHRSVQQPFREDKVQVLRAFINILAFILVIIALALLIIGLVTVLHAFGIAALIVAIAAIILGVLGIGILMEGLGITGLVLGIAIIIAAILLIILL